MATKPAQTIIVGCMVISVANAVVANLSSSTTKGPAVRIVIGGWVVTVGLLIASESQPEISEAFAILIVMATLFGPNGQALVNLIIGKTSEKSGSINVKTGGGSSTPLASGGDTTGSSDVSSSVSGGGLSDVARAVALRSGALKPDLVAVAGGFKLDRVAASAYNRAVTYYGKPIPIGNSFRTYEQQLDAYNKSGGASGTFGTPGTSLHEKGLAIDLTNQVQWEDPKLLSAMSKAGFYRAGKKINGVPEPWHWSYGVKG